MIFYWLYYFSFEKIDPFLNKYHPSCHFCWKKQNICSRNKIQKNIQRRNSWKFKKSSWIYKQSQNFSKLFNIKIVDTNCYVNFYDYTLRWIDMFVFWSISGHTVVKFCIYLKVISMERFFHVFFSIYFFYDRLQLRIYLSSLCNNIYVYFLKYKLVLLLKLFLHNTNQCYNAHEHLINAPAHYLYYPSIPSMILFDFVSTFHPNSFSFFELKLLWMMFF